MGEIDTERERAREIGRNRKRDTDREKGEGAHKKMLSEDVHINRQIYGNKVPTHTDTVQDTSTEFVGQEIMCVFVAAL
jgi:hypothetical protein